MKGLYFLCHSLLSVRTSDLALRLDDIVDRAGVARRLDLFNVDDTRKKRSYAAC